MKCNLYMKDGYYCEGQIICHSLKVEVFDCIEVIKSCCKCSECGYEHEFSDDETISLINIGLNT